MTLLPARRRRLRERLTIPVDAARRKFLVAFGAAYLCIGFSYVAAPATATVRGSLLWIDRASHGWVPFWLLGCIWMAAGAVAVVSSFVPTTRDKPGFLVLSVPPSLWACSYLVAQVLAWSSAYQAPRAWVSVIVFGLIAFAVDVVSGMVDADLVSAHETLMGR